MPTKKFGWILSAIVVLPLGLVLGLFLRDHLPGELSELIGGHAPGGDEDEEAAPEVEPKDLDVHVEVAVATTADVPITIAAAGVIESSPNASRIVSTRVAGRIAENLVREGQTVKKGDLLVRFDSEAFVLAGAQADAALAQAESQLAQFERGGRDQREAELAAARQKAEADKELAKSRAERQRELAKDGLVAPVVLLEAEQSLAETTRAAELAVRALEAWNAAGAQLAHASLVAAVDGAKAGVADAAAIRTAATVVAPDDATIVEWNATVGKSFEAGAPLGTLIVANGRVARFEIPAAIARTLEAGAEATFHGVGGENGDGAVRGKGHLALLPVRIESDSGLVDVQVEVDESSARLLLGDLVYGAIVIGTHHGAITVPESAVVRADDATVVMIVGDDGFAHETAVDPQERFGGRVAVTGVKVGDKVITAGGYNLPDGAKVVVK